MMLELLGSGRDVAKAAIAWLGRLALDASAGGWTAPLKLSAEQLCRP
jgi:hypothetical protein